MKLTVIRNQCQVVNPIDYKLEEKIFGIRRHILPEDGSLSERAITVKFMM